ncbi:M20/M25/M40 family metallo-hydrolase, partial [Cohaesibacter celericrescens]
KELGAELTILPNQTGEKQNLVARFGPSDKAGIVLSGHTDVVPANEDSWKTPAFEVNEINGLLFGRGTCDMKGFAACVLATAPVLASKNLQQPVYLCFSYDEEVGCLGVPAIAEYLASLDTPPKLAIIGEPSNMQLITGQKGKIAMRAHVKGSSGHSSFSPKHLNAIELAGHVIDLIEKRGVKYEKEGPFDPEFTIPHSTMLVTMIKGGVATNVTPDTCSFTFELRSILEENARPDMDALLASADAEVAKRVSSKSVAGGIEWQEIFSYPAMGDARQSEGFQALAHIMPELGGKVSYGSEGGVFETIGGIPSVIVGPGSIEQAHKPNEFVAISQIEQCLSFLDLVAAEVSK